MAFACRRLLQEMKAAPSIRYYKNLQDVQHNLSQDERRHDLVISSYALGELQTMKERISAVRQLWALTGDILILIEPGTPQGSKLIRESRAHILALEKKRCLRQKRNGDVCPEREDEDIREASTKPHQISNNAFVVAPCPHDGVCPMDSTDRWCHFIQRLERTPSQRTTKRLDKKGALRGYEDEKFSFVVIRRGLRPRVPWPLDGVELKLSEDEQQLNAYNLDGDNSELDEDNAEIAYDTLEDESETEEPEVNESRSEDGLLGTMDYSHGSHPWLLLETTGGYDHLSVHEGAATIPAMEDGEREDAINLGAEGTEVDGKQLADLGGGWARIVFAPIRRGKHVFLDLCCSTKNDGSEGKLDRQILSRGQNVVLHRQAKKSRWGDLWPCSR